MMIEIFAPTTELELGTYHATYLPQSLVSSINLHVVSHTRNSIQDLNMENCIWLLAGMDWM